MEKSKPQRELMSSINAGWLAHCPSWGCFFRFLLKKRKVLRIACNGEEVDQNIFPKSPPPISPHFFILIFLAAIIAALYVKMSFSWSVSQLQTFQLNQEFIWSCKLLGVIIQSNLKWNKNTDDICKWAFSRMWMIRRLKALGANR